jgi:homoserine dehydrogenase
LADLSPPIRNFNLCLLGFGNVNRTLVRMLAEREPELHARGIGVRITGIASRRLGWLSSAGVPPAKVDAEGLASGTLALLERVPDFESWLQAARPDVLLEATSLDPHRGQPALDYLRAALRSDAHVITANKGPVLHGYRELTALAAERKRRFLFEATVMDGVPIFSLFRDTLPMIKLQGFRGILNSTTNVILGGMEEGLTFEASLNRAQEIGVAETDASNDIEGWDAAIKTALLVNVLMDVPLQLDEVNRQGIAHLAAEEVRSARESGAPYKLVCRADRDGDRVNASVCPERVPSDDPLSRVSGTSSIVAFRTDIFPDLVITENNPGLEATAYGMFADLIRAAGS